MEGKSSDDHGQVANGNKTDYSWWVDTWATRHVCKDINLYKVYKSLEDGPSLYMGNDSMVKCVHHLYGIHDCVM
nr:zinc finger, CCHC-type [Ipomoea batatas]